MFDMSNRTTFDDLEIFYDQFYDYGADDIPSIVIGNKCDLFTQNSVSEAE